MTEPCHIRPALSGDVPEIFRIRLAVRENALSLEELAALGITPETVTAMIAGNGGRVAQSAWVAELAGSIVGFSMIDQEAGEVFATFVDPRAEGRGIGRALMAQAEAALFASHEVIRLETARGSRAEGFYRRLGWTAQAGRLLSGDDIILVKLR